MRKMYTIFVLLKRRRKENSREIKKVTQVMNTLTNTMNTDEAMNELIKRMKGTRSNEEFLTSMNG